MSLLSSKLAFAVADDDEDAAMADDTRRYAA